MFLFESGISILLRAEMDNVTKKKKREKKMYICDNTHPMP